MRNYTYYQKEASVLLIVFNKAKCDISLREQPIDKTVRKSQTCGNIWCITRYKNMPTHSLFLWETNMILLLLNNTMPSPKSNLNRKHIKAYLIEWKFRILGIIFPYFWGKISFFKGTFQMSHNDKIPTQSIKMKILAQQKLT